jgi:hypothetical protein
MAIKNTKVEKLAEHLENLEVQRLLHHEKYKGVMEELKLKATNTELKEYLFSFFETKDVSKTVSLAKNLVSDCEEKDAIFKGSIKTYEILGLDCNITTNKVDQITDLVTDPYRLKDLLENSIVIFNNKLEIERIETFEEAVFLTATRLYEGNHSVYSSLDLLLTKGSTNELVLAVCSHPFLFKIMTPALFLSVALPLLSSVNYWTFVKAVYTQCKGFVLPTTGSVEIFNDCPKLKEAILNGTPLKIELPIQPEPQKNNSSLEDRTTGFSRGFYYIKKPLFYGITSVLIGYGAVYLNVGNFNLTQLFEKKVVVKALVAPLVVPGEEARKTGALVRTSFVGFFKGLLNR